MTDHDEHEGEKHGGRRDEEDDEVLRPRGRVLDATRRPPCSPCEEYRRGERDRRAIRAGVARMLGRSRA